MNISGSALNAAVVLGAVFWMGSAGAAPLPSYPRNSAALFASAMQDHAPVEEIESAETLAPNLQR